MKRDITAQLIRWKEKESRKPLIITGVRQCGKTFTLKEFGTEYFEDMAYFNFDGDDGLQAVFDYDLHVDRILDELSSVILGRKIVPGKTLVIFDEVQACPRAISALKYFAENMPELHIIAAGSLLGVALSKGGISFPVGKVERLPMYPLSFEEFVRADGGEKYLDGLRKFPLDRELPVLYTVPMEKYLKNYYIVGGMPEAVQKWVDHHDYQEVEAIQDQILQDYADDFGKYATPETTVRIRMVWDAIPSQIARENNKFVFSHVKSGARAKDLEDALGWLLNAGLAYRLEMVPVPELPLSGMADHTYFKVYMADIGLLRRKASVHYRTILEDSNLYVHFKGAMAENYVMTQMKAQGIDSYFWRTKADAEIDFITDFNGFLTPVEVKSADNTRAKSLHLFCNRFAPMMAIKTSLKNVGSSMDGGTCVRSVPLYLLFRLREYMNSVLETSTL